MNAWVRTTLIVSTALAYPQAFAPIEQPWILAFVFPAFLAALSGLRPPSARGAGFVWGMLVYGAGLSWFSAIFGLGCIALFGILAIFTGLFAGACAKAEERGWSGLRLACFIAVAWSALEFIRCELFWLKFPWLSLGSAAGPNFLHPIIGTYGIGFLLALGSAVTIHCRKKIRVAGGVTIILIPALSLFDFGSDSRQVPIRISGVQAEEAMPEEYLKESQSAPPDTKIIVWPEYSIPFDLRKSTILFDQIKRFAAARNVIMIVGTQTHTSVGIWRNTALTFDGTRVLGEHYKQHTVHFFNDGTPGTSETPVETLLGKIGTPVCFDCDFQNVVRNMTANGAEFFVVPMMDAEKWTLKQHLQHAHLFRLRAIENGRWMAIVGTSGISQIIDPDGRVRSSIPPMTPGILNGSVAGRTHLTFFTRCGWIIPWIVLVVFCLTLPVFFRRRRCS